MPIIEPHQSLQQIVYIFHFVKDTGIIPQSLLKTGNVKSRSIHALTRQISAKNRHIVMFILMANFITKIGLFYYELKSRQALNGRFRHTPRELWRNDYPIVLVHGYAGGAPDQSRLMGSYFIYALK